ncbi:AraC family transcriptional regulator [Enterococcus casseliflavus]|nr:AraC family transcriptional regulator [Enterococcus casseliflavus]
MDKIDNIVSKMHRIDNAVQLIEPFINTDPLFDPYKRYDENNNLLISFDTILSKLSLSSETIFTISSHYLEFPSSLHHHDYIEIVYLPEGRLLNIVDHQPYIMESGSLFLINSGVSHLLAPFPDELTKPFVVNLLVDKKVFAESFPSCTQLNPLNKTLFTFGDYLIYHREDLQQVNYYLHRLIMEYYQNGLAFSYSVFGFLMIFLDQLAQLQKPLKEGYDPLAIKVLQVIKEHPETANLSDISEKLNYSKGYLSRHVKKQTKKTISQLIADEKLLKAEHYLTDTDLTMTEISMLINYKSESHFYRSFKEKYHLTPSQYRSLYR